MPSDFPPDAGSPALISLAGVQKRFGELHVLRDIDLAIGAGEVVSVIGPSGSGKSTLCRVMNGLERVDAGSVTVGGRPIPRDGKALAGVRADVAMVFQSFNLFPHRTILENVTLGPVRVRQQSADAATTEALEILERVGVADQAHKFPAELSGGQQQRVGIARALAMHPKAILFDEPTSALDPEMVTEVLTVIGGLAAESITMVVVTHEMAFARRIADRVVFMADGRIVEEGEPEAFFTSPVTDRARDFLAKMLSH